MNAGRAAALLSIPFIIFVIVLNEDAVELIMMFCFIGFLLCFLGFEIIYTKLLEIEKKLEKGEKQKG